jgi:hypothetical protein
MSTFGTGLTEGGNLVANANLSAKQFSQSSRPRPLVKSTLRRRAARPSPAFSRIPRTPAKPSRSAIRLHQGQGRVGGFTAGDSLQTETGTGKLITKTSTNTIVAVAIETCAADEIGLVRVLASAG